MSPSVRLRMHQRSRRSGSQTLQRWLTGINSQGYEQVNASADYKVLLKDYIDYANKFRHAAKEGTPKPALSPKEVESFIYLTGIFIRLAMP